MKVKNHLKKAFAVSLAAVTFVSQNAGASSFWDDFADNSLSNVTPGGTIKDQNGRIYYTTSIYFRFGNAFSTYEPIVQFSPPKMSLGCGGLSVKGMFIHILGLDRLSLMLKNAGASLAWGIAIGLIYSLPGISASFSFLNAWAKKIQQLLQNACQSGMNIGKRVGDSIPGLEPNGVVDKFFNDVSDSVKSLDSAAKSVADSWGIGEYFDDDMVFNFGDDTDIPKSTKEKVYRSAMVTHMIVPSVKGNAIVELLKALEADNSKASKFIADIFNKHGVNEIKNFSAQRISITYNGSGLSTVQGENIRKIPIGAIASYLSTNSENVKAQVARDIFGARMVTAVGTDVGIGDPKATIEKIGKIAQAFKKISENGNVDDSVSRYISKVMRGEISVTNPVMDQPEAPLYDTASQVVEYFWYGKGGTNSATQSQSGWNNASVSADSSPSYELLGQIGAMDFIVVALPDPDDPQNNNKKDFVFIPVNESKASFFDMSSMNNKGAILRSRELIEKYISGEVPDSSDIVFLVPNIFEKIRIIQESPQTRRRYLIDVLAKYNAYHATLTALSGVSAFSSKLKGQIPAVHFESGALQTIRESRAKSKNIDSRYRSYDIAVSTDIKLASKMYRAMKQRLDQIAGNSAIKTSDQLERLFKEQDIANKQRVIKHLQ